MRQAYGKYRKSENMRESGYKWNASNWNELPRAYERRKVFERTAWGWSVEQISQDMAISEDKVREYLRDAPPNLKEAYGGGSM